MKNIIKYNLILLAIFVFACKPNKKFEGPELSDLYGEFKIIDSLICSIDSVDFSINQQIFFNAKFTKAVDWKISIKGLSSGAEKIINGKSKLIEITNSFWTGNTSKLPMFTSENCLVSLTFPTEKDTLNSSVKVIKPKINSGYLIADFESGYNNLWTKFVQSGASMDCQIRNVKPIPQGDNFYNMAGTVNWDWLVSLIDFNANANGVDRFPLNTNPNNIYFNAMVWGEPGLDNTLLLFQFKEDDNTNGTFESSSEDQYDYQIKIDWSGWKLISIKYSDLGTLVNGEPAIPKGNKQRNPNNLVRLSVLHLADPSSGFAKTKIDYIIFTDSKSLEP